METSTGITASSQDITRAGTVGRALKGSAITPGRRHADGSTGTQNGWAKRVAAVTLLGLAGALSVTACSTGTSPTPTHVAATEAQPSNPAPTPTAQQPVVTNPSQPDSGAGETAQNIADYLVSTQFEAGDGTTAASATCDPATVSDPPAVTTPTTVSCDITYSDGSVWQQTVTVTYDNDGTPATVSTDHGVQLVTAANE